MTTTTEQCKCTQYMDIRGRCEPTDASWAKCPVKVDTTFFILNHSEDYKKFCLETVGTRAKRNKKARKIAWDKYGLTVGELDELEECFADDDACCEEFQCRFCSKPISLEDEDVEGKYDHCEDCWVCFNCYDEHYCSICKEYSEEDLVFEKEWKCEECIENDKIEYANMKKMELVLSDMVMCSNCNKKPPTKDWVCFPEWCDECDGSLFSTRHA